MQKTKLGLWDCCPILFINAARYYFPTFLWSVALFLISTSQFMKVSHMAVDREAVYTVRQRNVKDELHLQINYVYS